MSLSLRVLFVAASQDEVRLLASALQHYGYDLQFERVDSLATLQAALSHQTWDAVIVDNAVPNLSALAAMAPMIFSLSAIWRGWVRPSSGS